MSSWGLCVENITADLGTWIRQYQDLIEVFVLVFLTLLASWIAGRVLDSLEKRFAATKNVYDDAVLFAARKPLVWLILLLGLSHAAEIAGSDAEVELFELIAPLRTLGVIVLVAMFAWRAVRFVEERVISPEFSEQPVDATTATAIGKLLRLSILITAVITAAQTLGFSIAGLLAMGGVGGIAIGFAARDLLANFFGALMIYMDRPFAVGEWIRSPDRNIEGTVEEIGWRLTRIRTFDRRPLYVPNAIFTQIALENPGRMSNRRIFETVGVRYTDVGVLPKILEDVRSMLSEHPDIAQDRILMVNFDSFGASSLDFMVYAFTKTTVWTEFHVVKEDVLFKIAAIIAGHGGEIAFPTRTLHVDSMPVEDRPATVEATQTSEQGEKPA
ncbi:MAG: mechanosensitive ion channel family protein [Gammaproteobacteria bacterium]|nr:mechanosensitive ion channel family protein [Gammaproteobacteria bacterium]